MYTYREMRQINLSMTLLWFLAINIVIGKTMTNKERIIIRYLNQRWYKKALVITESDQDYLSKINVLKLVCCSGYLRTANPIGCTFDIDAWPFDYKFFDLIILDESFVGSSKQAKALLNQLYFCLADDGEVVVACSGNIRSYKLASMFLANGFISKNLRLINATNNFIVNMIKRVVSKNFVMIFKKDNFFTVDPLKVKDLVEKPVKKKVYSGGCARELYGNIQEKK